MIEFIFLHIPKTGGSSLLKILEQHYGQDNVYRVKRDECLTLNKEGKLLSSILPKNIKAIHGHFRYKEIEDIIKRDKPQLVTFLREPIARIISNFNWWKQTILSGQNKANIHRIDETFNKYIRNKETRNKISYFLEGSNLTQYSFIGFLENYNSDVKKLAKLLGWEIDTITHEKDSSHFIKKESIELTPLLKTKLTILNLKDIRLYYRCLSLNK